MFLTSYQSQSKFLTCRFRSRRVADSSSLCHPERQPRTSSTCGNPLLFKHSCISLWAKCFVSMSAGFSTPGTFMMVSLRRATASCTHKTWVWRCLTRPTQRLEAIALRNKEMPPSITYEDEVDRRVFAHPAQSPSEKTFTIRCSACLLYTTKHLELPLRNRTRHLKACMFSVLGCCIRLASSLTANCSSRLS